MEWNTPQWEWDNLVMFNAKAAELPKKLQSMEWDTNADGDIEFGSLHSHGGGSGSLAPGRVSDDASSAKSSKSTSVDSSSIARASKVTLEEAFGDPNDKKVLKKSNAASSLSHETSVGSGEAVIGLKLGQRTYFEDFCAGANFKASSTSGIPISSEPTVKRHRGSSQSFQVLCCQVDGCNLDISSAKEYHRKHRICEAHSKCPKVIVGGVERRFCQQCSRFHGLAEFDEKKRSCRRRLSEHNARRRKPRAEMAHLDYGWPSSSPYDGKQHMGVVNKLPFLQSRPLSNSEWDNRNPLESKFTKTMACLNKIPVKTGATDERFFSPKKKTSNSVFVPHKADRLLPGQSTPKISNGVEQCVLPSNMVAAQDIHRALSLLSSNSWSSCALDPMSIDPATQMDNIATPRSSLHSGNHVSPLSAEIWKTEQQSTESRSHISASQSKTNVQFQEFQLFTASYDSGFNSNQFN